MINERLISEEYDLKYFGEPSHRYLICSTPRSGSTMLTRLLTQTGLAGCPEEYFREERRIPWMKRLNTTRISLDGYLREVEKRRTSANGVFGLKLHSRDFLKVFRTEVEQRAGQRWLKRHDTVFLCRRKNKLDQAISLYKALLSDVWSIEGDPKQEIMPLGGNTPFSAEKISHHLHRMIIEEEYWLSLLDKLSIPFHEVWYDDLVSDANGVVKNMLKCMNIDSADLPELEVTTRRQADNENQILKRQFIESIGLTEAQVI